MNPMTGGKTCWSIFKAMLNNKEFPSNISPPFHGSKYVTALDKIPELLFAKSSSIRKSSCDETCDIACSDDIAIWIQNLYPNKAHGHDMRIISMLNLCKKSMCKRLI